MKKMLFTSESVTEGHPDKISDKISDAILDEILRQDPQARVACETFCTTGLVSVMGEITTSAYVDIQTVVRETVREIGYTRAKFGFDCDSCAVIMSARLLRTRMTSHLSLTSPAMAYATSFWVTFSGNSTVRMLPFTPTIRPFCESCIVFLRLY